LSLSSTLPHDGKTPLRIPFTVFWHGGEENEGETLSQYSGLTPTLEVKYEREESGHEVQNVEIEVEEERQTYKEFGLTPYLEVCYYPSGGKSLAKGGERKLSSM